MKDFNFRQEPKYTHLNMQEIKSQEFKLERNQKNELYNILRKI